jgi:NO-binding membrane sensor protein with MHYT domain
VVTVHNFSYGLLNPLLGYAVSCLGAFLGLRCVILARAYQGASRARWLVLGAVCIGAVGIWAMHFIAMLGFTIPDGQVRYNVPLTIASMLLAVVVVGVGLFIVGWGGAGFGRESRESWSRLLAGGVIIGVGVAGMHYLGMAAMSMTGSISYNIPLVALSVLIAIVAGTAALWIGTWVRGVAATIGAALVMGMAVSGMHYTGMAALKVTGSMASMSMTVFGATAGSFLIPLLVAISLLSFGLTLALSMTPGEDEILADREIRARLEALERQRGGERV